MDLLRTDRTYKTRANAVKALETACTKLGCPFDSVRYVIAVNEAGRFAPAVVSCFGIVPLTAFPHVGVTIIG